MDGDVIQIQPHPIHTQVARIGKVTAIARSWASGDSNLCRLCPQCNAANDRCLVIFQSTRPVPNEEIPLYSIAATAPPNGESVRHSIIRKVLAH